MLRGAEKRHEKLLTYFVDSMKKVGMLEIILKANFGVKRVADRMLGQYETLSSTSWRLTEPCDRWLLVVSSENGQPLRDYQAVVCTGVEVNLIG
jgi:hypothetical protein